MNVHGPFSEIIDASIPDGQFAQNILRSHVGFSHQLTISLPPHHFLLSTTEHLLLSLPLLRPAPSLQVPASIITKRTIERHLPRHIQDGDECKRELLSKES
jgi:hypothetical protein